DFGCWMLEFCLRVRVTFGTMAGLFLLRQHDYAKRHVESSCRLSNGLCAGPTLAARLDRARPHRCGGSWVCRWGDGAWRRPPCCYSSFARCSPRKIGEADAPGRFAGGSLELKELGIGM